MMVMTPPERDGCSSSSNDDDDDGSSNDDDDDDGSSSRNRGRSDGAQQLATGPPSSLDASPEELQRRAKMLRDQATAIRTDMERNRQLQVQKETRNADRWLDDVLVHHKINDDAEVLRTLEQAQHRLVEGRYSPDQVGRMFERLCELSHVSGRNSLATNARLQLLVEAAGKVDELEPEVNPNKRWKGSRVEHQLHKKLFAKEWGIDLDSSKEKIKDAKSKESDERDERYWKTRRR
jgi:hypothetical protein